MELTKLLTLLATVLPAVYGAPQKMANDMHPDILAAMKRDLGLSSHKEAADMVARNLQSTDVIENVRRSTGDAFAGGWIHGDEVRVGVTDEAAAAHVTAAGATPIMMRNSLSKLEKIKDGMDKMLIGEGNATAPADPNEIKARQSATEGKANIASYFVDVASNKIVIEVIKDDEAAAKKMAEEAGLAEGEYEVRKVESLASPFYQGGDKYGIDGRFQCSVGFAVQGGFVSAGHCGQTGSVATTAQGQRIGTFAASVYPGHADMAFIRTDGLTVEPTVSGYQYGQNYPITGSRELEVGAAVCRSGFRSSVTCGTIRQKGISTQYSDPNGGPPSFISGLTATDACSDHGDSGGSVWNAGQAQGVLSGGGGNPYQGCVTYYYPVNPILQTYGLTLTTTSGRSNQWW
ncbi:secreted serine protease [Cordyceps fumosorosea ARSEF 2679]|uniref:Secreted serine protease n=1 Tax=Cordyceps fumosorosea (strain ARSEF 2679) TaxID=1081104 RepID=A0A168D9F5_CORFA|nr:secreted serine protease [Cordyceps fumosorosea ARSEF 2679]OAA72321.1 secreted serine protease [Cordyceps fumosorosea ARSEF 2679]